MRKGGLLRRSLYAMALLAVALFNLASVQSTVMQATGSSSGMRLAGPDLIAVAEICHTAAPSQDPAKPVVHPDQGQRACPFCEVAANPPLCETAVSVPSPGMIAWTSYGVQHTLGARGPPAFAPNARGPPTPP
jgi:hypothetical protein